MAEEHKGLPVSGYRPQPQWAVDAVNANKRLEESVLRITDYLSSLSDVDKRWLAIGRTHIEEGFMAVNRAIFKPERIRLDSGE